MGRSIGEMLLRLPTRSRRRVPLPQVRRVTRNGRRYHGRMRYEIVLHERALGELEALRPIV